MPEGVLDMVKGDLTKEEAYQKMLEGEKITHTHFDDNEYVYMKDPHNIWSEDGFDFNSWWRYDSIGADSISVGLEKPWRVYE
jgi:hypothetical protein